MHDFTRKYGREPRRVMITQTSDNGSDTGQKAKRIMLSTWLSRYKRKSQHVNIQDLQSSSSRFADCGLDPTLSALSCAFETIAYSSNHPSYLTRGINQDTVATHFIERKTNQLDCESWEDKLREQMIEPLTYWCILDDKIWPSGLFTSAVDPDLQGENVRKDNQPSSLPACFFYSRVQAEHAEVGVKFPLKSIG
ncbi:hypothetical protein RRG08_048996 [Elysia crispata]|uniref:Uncharacterized protein n=1 Tax=Elysia crispata TaxID=231223 RepID=A0AAE0YD77_9GAST|nr:hypothetical protein RRG08_048996 [Elysia crispata]